MCLSKYLHDFSFSGFTQSSSVGRFGRLQARPKPSPREFSHVQDLRTRRSSLRQRGSFSSFVVRFCARSAQKRTTDKIGSTLLPQPRWRTAEVLKMRGSRAAEPPSNPNEW